MRDPGLKASRRKIIAWAPIVFFLLFSCKNDVRTEVGYFNVEVDTLQIEIPGSVSPNLALPTVWNEGEYELLVSYGYNDHSLVVLNLTDRRFMTKINLVKEGPDFIQSVRSISILNENLLLIGGDDYLTFMDFSGKVTRRLLLNSVNSDFEGFDFSSGRVLVNKYSGLQYSSNDSSVLLESYYFRPKSELQRNSLVVRVDLNDQFIEEYDVPDSLNREPGNYGELRGVNFWRDDNELILNYKSSSEVVIQKGEDQFKYNMSFEDNLLSATPIGKTSAGMSRSVFEHQVLSFNFYPVIKDVNGQFYYRVYKDEAVDIESDGKFFLSVSSPDFQKYNEYEFPAGYYIFGISSVEGLMFIAYNKHDSQVELINYKFELKE